MYNDNRYKEDRPIWLTSLAEADRHSSPSLSVEERLNDGLRRRRNRLLGQRAGAVALAATLSFALFQTSTMRSIPQTELVDESVADAITEAMNMSADDEADFVPTKFASEQPLEAVRVVRVSLPGSALPNYGLPPDTAANAGGEVTADLLLGQDGIARAIRIVK